MKKIFILIALFSMALQAKSQSVTGGDMENWKSYKSLFTTLSRPDGWYTTDSLYAFLKLASGSSYSGRVNKSTTVKHSGAASAMLTTSTDSLPTFMFNTPVTIDLSSGDFSYDGGTMVTKQIKFVNAWTQYSVSGSDSGFLVAEAYKNGIGAGGSDSVVGYGEALITKSSAFTKVSAEMEYDNATVVPDRIVILFVSNNAAVPSPSTVLYVDDVTLSDATGIETPMLNDQNIKVYPNPAVNQLHISTVVTEEMQLAFYNNAGQKVLTQALQNETDINVSSLAAGNYIYVISSPVSGHKFYSSTFSKQ